MSRKIRVVLVLLFCFASMFLPVFLSADSTQCKNPPFKLVTTAWDRNHFPSDPKWGSQVNPGTDPTCTGFPNPDTDKCSTKDFSEPKCSDGSKNELDEPGFWHMIFFCGWTSSGGNRVHGHVDWPTAVTYDGPIFFSDRSFDEDYTWSIKPNGLGGITSKNPTEEPTNVEQAKQPQFIHSECNGPETIDSFTVGQWKDFRDMSDDQRKALVRGKRSVITGLLGLDSEHGGYSELHPIYALAIETHPENTKDDVWTLFLRKNGNEGWCSKHDHPLQSLQQMKLIIPVPSTTPSPVGASIIKGSEFGANYQNGCPTFQFVPNVGVLVTINFPQTTEPAPVVEGDLHIAWIPKTGEMLKPFKVEETIQGPQELPEFSPFEKFTSEQKKNYLEYRKTSVQTFERKPHITPVCKPTTGPLTIATIEQLNQTAVTAGSTSSAAIENYYKQMLSDLERAAPAQMKILEAKDQPKP